MVNRGELCIRFTRLFDYYVDSLFWDIPPPTPPPIRYISSAIAVGNTIGANAANSLCQGFSSDTEDIYVGFVILAFSQADHRFLICH